METIAEAVDPCYMGRYSILYGSIVDNLHIEVEEW